MSDTTEEKPPRPDNFAELSAFKIAMINADWWLHRMQRLAREANIGAATHQEIDAAVKQFTNARKHAENDPAYRERERYIGAMEHLTA